MNKLYRFSPIQNEQELREAIDYVAQKTTELSRKFIAVEYPINYLTIFSHFDDEFENLKKILFTMGTLAGENNGPFIQLHNPIQLANGKLEKIRIRQPDPYRIQVGCNDFTVPDYVAFKEKYVGNNPNNFQVIQRPQYEMVEIADPDFDVLAYVVGKKSI
jgi:hypothetical protein